MNGNNMVPKFATASEKPAAKFRRFLKNFQSIIYPAVACNPSENPDAKYNILINIQFTLCEWIVEQTSLKRLAT